MFQLDALKLAEDMRREMVDFAAEDLFLRDDHLAEICRAIWAGDTDQPGLVGDLWVEGAFPSEQSGESLDSLARAGVISGDLRDQLDTAEAVPRARLLYTHQVAAIEQAREHQGGPRPALLVTAGTGGGKTESFLLPMLDDLYRNDRIGNGVRAIILYPMNALVNDQVDRLYGWLKGQSRIKLFHFTGETPEDRSIANHEDAPLYDPCRMRTRKEARGLETHDGEPINIMSGARGPTPDILVTNYSMLEYMLCRPQDASFFGPALRTMVLDEAHLYAGTLAAEITLLLRRVVERCGVQSTAVLQIATSATIGGDDANADDELQRFAADLFTKDESLVRVI